MTPTILRLVALMLAAILTGCFSPKEPPWDYLPSYMRTSVPYDAFATNPNFDDFKTLQAPAPGSIPRGFQPFLYGPDDAELAGAELTNPLEPTPENLARAEHLFKTFCWVCHGDTGLGDGPLIPKIAPPPAYNSGDVSTHPAGRIYHIITWGSGRMQGYRMQIAPEDRWRLVFHIQSLQRTPPSEEAVP